MTVRVSVDAGVATVVLDRPEKLNTINRQMRDELQAAWLRTRRPDVRVVIVTGGGDRAFCAGSDLTGAPVSDGVFAREVFDPGAADHLLTNFDPEIPTIAAINGYAVGGGLEIALACDVRLCVPHAEFGLGEVKVGSMPGAGGTQLVRAMGRSAAMQMLLTGERIDAAAALRTGLVSEVVPPDQLRARATEIARRIAANAPLAVRAVKQLVQFGDDAPHALAMRAERMAFGLIRETRDREEGRAAFREKRAPHFVGE